MWRVKRWLLSIATVFSLVICIAASVLWARNYFYQDEYYHWQPKSDRWWGFVIINGGVQLGRVDHASVLFGHPEIDGREGWHEYVYVKVVGRYLVFDMFHIGFVEQHGWIGFRFGSGNSSGYPIVRVWTIRLPLWFIVLLSVATPICWLRVAIRDRARRLRGRCLNCGYDLRASKDRCPECGQLIPPEIVKQTI
jgi:4-amino-4-deoxy-L-arabinose transferase-like glycosyltransferase